MCPACGSSETKQGCCGDLEIQCLKCGYRWQGEVSLSCTVPPGLAPTEYVVTEGQSPEVVLEDYEPLTDNQMWGE